MALFEKDQPQHHYGPQPPPGIVNEPGKRIIWFDGSPQENPAGWWASNFCPSPFRLNQFTYYRLAHPTVMQWNKDMHGSPEKRVFPNSEAAFQAFKTTNPHEFANVASQTDPHEAKRLGQAVRPLRSDWNAVKVDVMREVIRAKFSKQNPHLVEALLGSGDVTLVEGNTWSDAVYGVPVSTQADGTRSVYWGDGRGDGAGNLLGLLLMQRRAELRLGLDSNERRPRDTIEKAIHTNVVQSTAWLDLLRERRGAVLFEGDGERDGSMLIHCTAPGAAAHETHATSFKPEPPGSVELRGELSRAAMRLRRVEEQHVAGEQVRPWA